MFASLARAVALLLLLGQALVAQAHGHAGATWASGPAVHAPTPPGQSDDPVDCPVCRQVAQAGAYLASGSSTLVAPVTSELSPASTQRLTGAVAYPSHAWRSRAPPVRSTI